MKLDYEKGRIICFLTPEGHEGYGLCLHSCSDSKDREMRHLRISSFWLPKYQGFVFDGSINSLITQAPLISGTHGILGFKSGEWQLYETENRDVSQIPDVFYYVAKNYSQKNLLIFSKINLDTYETVFVAEKKYADEEGRLLTMLSGNSAYIGKRLDRIVRDNVKADVELVLQQEVPKIVQSIMTYNKPTTQ